MAEFHETGYGRRFFERDFPELVKNLERIAVALEKLNDRKIVSEALRDLTQKQG